MEREIRKEREERERRREDDGLFDRREKETSKYNYLVVKERERERKREEKNNVNRYFRPVIMYGVSLLRTR